MSTQLLRVSLSGTVLATALQHLPCTSQDLEGFLLGTVEQRRTVVTTDSKTNVTETVTSCGNAFDSPTYKMWTQPLQSSTNSCTLVQCSVSTTSMVPSTLQNLKTSTTSEMRCGLCRWTVELTLRVSFSCRCWVGSRYETPRTRSLLCER